MREPTSRRCGRRALLAATALALAAGPAPAATVPRLVQKKYAEITAGTAVAMTLRRPTTAGNLLVAYVVWDNPGAIALADGTGNTFAIAVGPTQAGGDPMRAELLYAANVAGGVDTVAATFATAITVRGALYVDEYSGLDRVAPLDGALAATGASPAIDSGPLATHGANALLVAAGACNGRAVRRLHGYRARAHRFGATLGDRVVTAPGTYDATATQNGTAWVMQLAAFRSAGATTPSTAYPLEVGPTGRYLVDQNGAPFLITGDSPQALVVNLSEADAETFFADRQAGGFNAVWINLLCDTYTGGRPDGSTLDGIVPFTTPGDLSTPNERYFARADDMLRLAAAHGLVVVLDPAETGGWLGVLQANGIAKARAYGRFLGSRYRSFDNIVWMSGNDFQSWQNPGDDAVVRAVALGIEDMDARHVHTVELDYPVSGSLDDPTWAPIVRLNASYTYYPTYAQVLTDYDRPNAIPTFLVEANYEFEHNAADEGTPAILRRQAYWALLSGAAGQLYGNHYTWPFLAGWQQNLDTPGSAQMGYVKFLFAPRRWYDLVPDQAHTVVVAGYGTYADSGALADNDYATAARTPDGALVMAYMPTLRTITVDMTRLAAPAQASWYDPTNGAFTPIAGSPLANAGTLDLAPPGPNAAGDGDWALVLDAGPVPPDTTPPSVPAGLVAVDVESTQASFAWSASHDDVGVAGYRVYRAGVFLRTTPSTSFTDAGLTPLTTYAYTVAAYDYANNLSGPSAPLPITTTSPGPTFVQAAAATPQSPQTVVTATYALAEAAGDTNIVAIGWNDVTASIVSVVDDAGNAYQPALATARGNGLSQAIYYAANVVAATQVTVTFDGPAVFVDLRITEYAGLRQTAPFDAGASGTGSAGTADAGSVSTAVPSELLFAAGMTGATFTSPGAGFTSRIVTSPDGDLVEDAVAAAAGSHGATASLSGGTWLLQLAAFRPAGS